MSASFDKRNILTYLVKKIDPATETFMCSMFDAEVDVDIEEFKYKIEESKLLKRTAVLKLILFPIEYFFSLLFINPLYTSEKIASAKLYWALLSSKISTDEFKKRLTRAFLSEPKKLLK